MQSPEQLEAVKQRYDFDAWRGINRLDRELSVHNISLPKELIAGLDPARVREVDPGDGARLLRVAWSVPGQPAALLTMDIRECESRDGAHQVLLELLADVQAPDVKRLGDDAPGDVAFAHDPATDILLARGNVVITIRNGGDTVVRIDDVAETIDQWIIRQHQ